MIKGYESFSSGLEEKIIKKIHRIQRRNLLIRQVCYSLLSMVSLFGTIFTVLYIVEAVSNSSLFDYIYLLFSDITTLEYVKELSISIIDSLPIFGMTLGLVAFGIFIWSIMKSLRIQIIKSSLLYN